MTIPSKNFKETFNACRSLRQLNLHVDSWIMGNVPCISFSLIRIISTITPEFFCQDDKRCINLFFWEKGMSLFECSGERLSFQCNQTMANTLDRSQSSVSCELSFLCCCHLCCTSFSCCRWQLYESLKSYSRNIKIVSSPYLLQTNIVSHCICIVFWGFEKSKCNISYESLFVRINVMWLILFMTLYFQQIFNQWPIHVTFQWVWSLNMISGGIIIIFYIFGEINLSFFSFFFFL